PGARRVRDLPRRHDRLVRHPRALNAAICLVFSPIAPMSKGTEGRPADDWVSLLQAGGSMRSRSLAGLFLCLWSLPAAAEIKMIGKPKVGFDADGSAGLDIAAPAAPDGFSVKEENGKVIFTLKMTAIDHGIELRNHHMCDKFADCEKFPTATLTIERSAIPIPTDGEKK